MWDLIKFFDTIAIPALIADALLQQYSPTTLHMTLLTYLAPRVIAYGDGVSKVIFPTNSVLAGCGEATNMARASLHRILDFMHVQHPRNQWGQFVDDMRQYCESGTHDVTGLCNLDASKDLAEDHSNTLVNGSAGNNVHMRDIDSKVLDNAMDRQMSQHEASMQIAHYMIPAVKTFVKSLRTKKFVISSKSVVLASNHKLRHIISCAAMTRELRSSK